MADDDPFVTVEFPDGQSVRIDSRLGEEVVNRIARQCHLEFEAGNAALRTELAAANKAIDDELRAAARDLAVAPDIARQEAWYAQFPERDREKFEKMNRQQGVERELRMAAVENQRRHEATAMARAAGNKRAWRMTGAPLRYSASPGEFMRDGVASPAPSSWPPPDRSLFLNHARAKGWLK